MAKKETSKKASSKVMKPMRRVVSKKNSIYSVVYLILNIILPGLGTLVAGKYKPGIWQIILTALAWITWMFTSAPTIYFTSFPLYIIALIWAIITSIKLIL